MSLEDTRHRIIVAGAAPDTGNLGVSALFESTVVGVARRVPGARLAVLDHGRGVRRAALPLADGPLEYECVGASLTRRLYRSDSWFRIRLASRLGGLGNAAAQRFLGARALLDVSGGDSFTDLYGPFRFEAIVRPKLTALEHGVPLVLLPQTYGPFGSKDTETRAARLVRGAAMAWARDERSFAVLRELLGDAFDPGRHRCGVDMAFLLEARPPRKPLPAPLDAWTAPARASEVFGINVSGLIHNDPEGARTRYGFRADYREVIEGLVRAVLDSEGVHVALVPHVITPRGHFESDMDACRSVAEAVGSDRVTIVPDTYDQAEVKSVIASMDWFCGTRMHSTIAALSSGVPTAAVAYSPKTAGVFETCGQGRHVVDPRSSETRSVVDALVASFTARDSARLSLAESLPRVLKAAQEQMDAIAAVCAPSGAEAEL